MLSDDGVRLFDFGLGQAEEGVLPGLPHLSRNRFNAWTPAYAAPELLEGEPMTFSADVFAVACVIYELAGGKHPFRRLPSDEARDERPLVKLRAPKNLPKRCWPVLRRALAFEVSQRTVTVAELREVLGGRSLFELRRWFRAPRR